MRRPLCVFCTGVLGALLLCAFLPQAGRLLPLAAIFVLGCAAFWRWGGAARGYAGCLLLGAVLGAGLLCVSRAQIAAVQTAWAGRTVAVQAEVESVSASYYGSTVSAVLRVRRAQGQPAGFRFVCAALPVCEAGDLVSARFALEAPTAARALDRYADGAPLEGDCLSDFKVLGRSGSFRARTARVQRALSASLRRYLDEDTGGVLAAMVVGDRLALPKTMNDAYRAAGLSHVLVVSGMHVSILCGDIFPHGRREQSYASRRRKAVLRALLALGLVGVTGFTPSVLRAAVAVWIGSLGVWVYGAPDALTSLAAAGVLMSLQNGYAACDVGFELSFAAVLGTLAGGELARRGREAYRKTHPGTPGGPARRFGGWLWDTLVVSACASAATFPVLVLRGLSASLYALVSSLAVLWLVEPMMLLGLGAAGAGLVPFAAPVHYVLSLGAGLLAYVLNAWAQMVAAWPGAQLWFDTGYAAWVCLVLLALVWAAAHWHIRLRTAVPALLLVCAAALGAGTALNRDVIRVELAGSATSPAAVITQGGRAVVLFRGGAAAQQAVEQTLARRGVRTVELLVDLRLDPQTPCTIEARQSVPAARVPAGAARTLTADAVGGLRLELYRTRSGCAALLALDGRSLLALSGTVRLAKPVRADWLLASPADPASFRWQGLFSLSAGGYRWQGEGAGGEPSSLALRPGGGARTGG